MNTITTNEWIDTTKQKPPKDRLVLVRNSEGDLLVAKWNGMYWVGQKGLRFTFPAPFTHWYMFEKFNPNNVEL